MTGLILATVGLLVSVYLASLIIIWGLNRVIDKVTGRRW